MKPEDKHWVAAVVKGGEELRIACDLSIGYSIPCYCPKISRWRKLPKHESAKQGRSRALFSSPLLPGYLFVSVQCDESLSRLLRTKNVYGVVRTSAGPCYARDCEIQALRELESQYNANKPSELNAFDFVAAKLSELVNAHLQGKHLRLISGPFEGLIATLRNSSVSKMQVGLTLNGKNITTSFDAVEVA